LTKADLLALNRQIEEWQPNVCYPYDSIVRFQGKNNSSNRVCDYLNIMNWINYFASSDKSKKQTAYYQAQGKFGNLCSPEDEWVALIQCFFCHPASMLFSLQCVVFLLMLLFTANVWSEPGTLAFSLVHLFVNGII
jgi:hypothetical protein